MKELIDFIQKTTGLNPDIQSKLLTSFIFILFMWIILKLIMKIVWKETEDVQTRYIWRKTLTYIFVVIGILLLGNVWFKSFKGISTYLGLLSAGLAVALKDPVVNIAGWLFIIVRRPFTIGDRVQIGKHAGDVIDVRVFQFTILEIGNWVDADQSTGRIIHIPNAQIFSYSLANYSRGFQYIWNEIPVLLTFESNWKKAKTILLRIAKEHSEHMSKQAEKKIKEASKKFMIFYKRLTPIVYTNVKNSGVLLTIRYLCEPHQRRGTEESIWEDILEEFNKCSDIDFAYPTQRFYNNMLEGKAKTKQSSEKEYMKSFKNKPD